MKAIQRLKAKTPSVWVRIGNGLIGASTFGATLAYVSDMPVLAYIVFGSGFVGKFLTQFAVEHEK